MILLIREVRARVDVSFKLAKATLEEVNEDVDEAVRRLLLEHPAVDAGASATSGADAPAEDPAKARLDWVKSQIAMHAAPAALSPGGIGRPLQELASALSSLEQGGTTAFGLTLDPSQRNDLAALVPTLREVLVVWRARLIEEYGAEGAKSFDTIAARNGVTLPGSSNEGYAASLRDDDAPFGVVLDGLEKTLGAEPELTDSWKKHGLVDDGELIVVRVGLPDPARLEAFAARFEAMSSRALPVRYLRMLARFNGIATYPLRVGADTLTRVDAGTLSEPAIWPIEAYGDHYLLDAVDLPGIESAFVFGGIADSGLLVLDLGPEASTDDAPVHWVSRDFASEAPSKIAGSLADFLTLYSQCRLSVSAVLAAARVPGWG